jgi:glycosyltransferase involved in cell wall biosynthesis
MQIAFLSTRPDKPSFRFRVAPLLGFFRARGHDCQTFFLPPRSWGRLPLYRRLARFDVVFLQKRLLARAELLFLRSAARTLIYDVDDAVMYDGDGLEDRPRRRRFDATVRAADLVICGNRYLADEASQAGDRIAIVPTCIDTEAFHPRLRPAEPPARVTLGWTGSRSTNAYLNVVLSQAAHLPAGLHVKVISDTRAGLELERLGRMPCTFVPWSTDREIREAATFDIGVMPLPDNAWTRGKCGFKALQYMALGIPAVCSPVGANREIIHDGVDGLFASSPQEWFRQIARLQKDRLLRDTIGRAGRRRVEEAYALSVHAPRLVKLIETTAVRLRRTA